jgi:hypothetical protein
MTNLRLASRLAAFLPIVLLVAACGGATASAPLGSAGTGASTGPGASSDVPSQSPGGGDLPSFAIPSFDLGQLAAGLENVDSYRVSITIDGVEQYKGVVVTKPVLSRDVTMTGGTRIIVIGNDAWIQSGGSWTAAPKEMAAGMFAAFDPTLLVGMFSGPQWAQSSTVIGTEEKNGVQAKHLLIDSSTAVGGFAGLPAGASLNLWIADEGYLVAVDAKGFGGGDMSIQVTGVDDPANKVEKPI